MTFLNAGALMAVSAAAIPILIHLFSRPRRREIIFSTLRFLKKLERKRMRRLNITQWILLAIRTLAILCVVMAFTRPAIRQTPGILTGEANTAAVFIIDNSLASQAAGPHGRLISLQRSSATSILELFGEGDEILLITGGNPAGIVGVGPYSGVSGKIRADIFALETVDSEFDLAGSLELGLDFLNKSTLPNRELYIFSPFFVNEAEIGKLDSIPGDISFFPVVSSPENLPNLAIIGMEVETRIIQPHAPVTFAFTVANFSDEPRREAPFSVFLENDRVAAGNIDIDPRSQSTIRLKVTPSSGGVAGGYGRLEIEDNLEADNRRYFSFEALDKVRVALVGNEEEMALVELALKPTARSGLPVEPVKLNDRSEWGKLASFDAVFLLGPTEVSPYIAGILKDMLKNEGGLLISPSVQTDIQSLNRDLLLPLGAPRLGETVIFKTGIGLDRIDYSHPLFEGVFTDNRSLDTPLFFKYFTLYGGEGFNIMEFSGGIPYLREIQLENGKILLFTAGFSGGWSDIFRRGIFAPLLYRCAVYLAGGEENRRIELSAGEEIEFFTDRSEEKFSMDDPLGDVSEILPITSTRALLLKYDDTAVAGLYRLWRGDKIVEIFPVNPASEGSNLSHPSGLERFQLETSGESVEIAALVNSRRMGLELWRWFFAIALILLGVEMVISKLSR